MTQEKDFDWYWDNYDQDPNRPHQYINSQMVNSGVCPKCQYRGTTVSSECKCGEIHSAWCPVCWGYWPTHQALERAEKEFG